MSNFIGSQEPEGVYSSEVYIGNQSDIGYSRLYCMKVYHPETIIVADTDSVNVVQENFDEDECYLRYMKNY